MVNHVIKLFLKQCGIESAYHNQSHIASALRPTTHNTGFSIHHLHHRHSLTTRPKYPLHLQASSEVQYHRPQGLILGLHLNPRPASTCI